MPKAIRITAILLLVLAGILMVLAVGIGRKSPPPPAERTAQSSAAPSVPKRSVVVAARDLPAGQPISAADLSTTQLPATANEGFASISDVEGRIPTARIAAGAMLEQGQLLQGIAAGIKPGERAVAVPVDELAGVSNRVAPGDYVDVFMSLQGPNETGTSRGTNTQAHLLLSRLRVLGYGNDDIARQQARPAATEEDAPEATPEPGSRAETIASRSGNGSNTSEPGQPARSAILAVPVEDAGRLLLAAHSGKLFLALRNPGDTGLADSAIFAEPRTVLALRRDLDAAATEAAGRPENRAYAGIDLQALAGDSTARSSVATTAAPRPRTARPASRHGIEIIRGTTPSNHLSSP